MILNKELLIILRDSEINARPFFKGKTKTNRIYITHFEREVYIDCEEFTLITDIPDKFKELFEEIGIDDYVNVIDYKNL